MSQRSRSRSGSNRMLLLVGAGVVVVAAAIAIAFSGGDGDGGNGAAESSALRAADVTVEGSPLPAYDPSRRDPAAGSVAPTVTGAGFDGRTVSIRPDGTPKVVIFLAHWCPHCQREVPRVQDWLDDEGNPEGVALYSVSTSVSSDRPNHPPDRWLEREGWSVPVVRDSDENTVANAYGLTGFPYFVFLDGDNKVVGRASGELEIDQIEEWIDRLRATE